MTAALLELTGHHLSMAERRSESRPVPPVRTVDHLRWEHLARRITSSPWYFLVFGIAVLMAWLDNMAIAVGITLSFVIVVLVMLPRTKWGKARTGDVSPRDAMWADVWLLAVGVAYLVFAALGRGRLWSTLLAGGLALGYLTPRVLHWLDRSLPLPRENCGSAFIEPTVVDWRRRSLG